MSCIISLNLIKNFSCLITYSASRESRQNRTKCYNTNSTNNSTDRTRHNTVYPFTAVYKVIYTFKAVLPLHVKCLKYEPCKLKFSENNDFLLYKIIQSKSRKYVSLQNNSHSTLHFWGHSHRSVLSRLYIFNFF